MTGLAPESCESRLIARSLAGDAAAFDTLVARHMDGVYRVALRMLGNREEAEDVQQETFIQAYTQLRRFRGEAAFGTWLYAIAVRFCLTKKRQAATRRVDLLEDLVYEPGDPSADPQQRLAVRESAAQAQRALLALTPLDRLVIILKFTEQLDHQEIARILRCSEQASRARLCRARRLFREAYESTE